MPRPVVRRVPVEGPAVAALDRLDHGDAFAVAVDPRLPADPGWWRQRLLGGGSPVAAAVMRMRNAAVRPFGLQGGAMRDVPVLARTADEEVIGLDDRHLDFRLGFRVRDGRLTLTTAVRFHGVAGRLYFLPVRPVHELVVVPAMARRAGCLRA